MPDIKEWTLMFYFASDNPLAPGIISQLKAIKAAGFHKEANVIAQFDPYTEGTPTHVFDINIMKKLESPEDFHIGFESEDPFFRNLVEDKLWRDERDRGGELMRDRIRETAPKYAPGVPPSGTIEANGQRMEQSPCMALDEFLRFCSARYPAHHYMLFILGHGVVVGNDVFLFDQHAGEQSLSLTGLRRVLENFTLDIRSHYGSFELLSFHSCSVSSLEVAYELRNTAKYMLASQGTTFVGSWPYREILLRVFKSLKDCRNKMDNAQIKTMLKQIFTYCLHNSTDFLLAGYPFDLCLCDLTKMGAVKTELSKLSEALIKGLKDCQLQESILLSHLESQSFYQEIYTDVIDFCRCIYVRTKRLMGKTSDYSDDLIVVDKTESAAGVPALEAGSIEVPALEAGPIEVPAPIGNTSLVVANPAASGSNGHPKTDETIRMLQTACADVIKAIRGTIVNRGFAGPEYQYARGLSIYFPWSRPSDDSGILLHYSRYRLAAKDEPENGEMPAPTWLDFLNAYFNDTRRKRAIYEEAPEQALLETEPGELTAKEKLLEDKIALVYMQAAPSVSPNVAGGLQKTDKTDPMGVDGPCPSIKNFPRDTRLRRDRKQPVGDNLAFAPAFFRQES